MLNANVYVYDHPQKAKVAIVPFSSKQDDCGLVVNLYTKTNTGMMESISRVAINRKRCSLVI
jgi:hypothetical protein